MNFQPSHLAFAAGLRKALVIGAFLVGLVDQGGSYLARLRSMGLACLAISVSALLGWLVGSIGWLFVLLLALFGFAAGMLAALGQPALVIGMQMVLALAISSYFHLSPLLALETGGLLMVGGPLQMAVAVAPWPFSQYRYEREALARAYLALAEEAPQLSDATRGLHASEALVQAWGDAGEQCSFLATRVQYVLAGASSGPGTAFAADRPLSGTQHAWPHSAV